MISRKRYVIKTKHKRRPLKPDDRHEEHPTASASLGRPHPVAAPRHAHASHRQSPGQIWKTIGMLIGAVLLVGAGIYYLATSNWGRRPTEMPREIQPLTFPTSPAHRSAVPHAQLAGTVVEHSLANRAPPTEQGFINAFGGTRNGADPAQAAGKIELRGKLSGNCAVGKDGIKDVQDCLERHSVKGN
jgi:hypothetical protein